MLLFAGSGSGWIFDPDKAGEIVDIRRTCDEFCKSFNAVMDFLEFTTESELDFSSGFLPTLDTQTKVEDDGSITYKFFSKPTNSNLVIENGTALPKNIIFGSLRQEIVRRLQNTSTTVGKDVKVHQSE